MEITFIIKLIEERVELLQKGLRDSKLQVDRLSQQDATAVSKELDGIRRNYTAMYSEWYKLTEALVHLRS